MNLPFKIFIPEVGKILYPGSIWSKPATKPTVYLTFDDGPTKAATSWVLDILEEHQISATFFQLGNQVESSPALAKRVTANHKTGLHGYAHLNGWKTNSTEYLLDFERAAELDSSNTFRPPYGRISPSQHRAIKQTHQVVFWSCLVGDYNASTSISVMQKRIKNAAFNGSIFVFHDSKKAFPQLKLILPWALEFLRSEGFEFSVL